MSRKDDIAIEYLSSEIKIHMTYLTTFRTRVGFTILIGPFVLLGSFLIATDGTVKPIVFTTELKWSIVVAGISYLAMALFGAWLDKQITDQCNKWRQQIYKLHRRGKMEIDQILFAHKQWRGYFISLLLVLVTFLSISYFLSALLLSDGSDTLSSIGLFKGVG